MIGGHIKHGRPEHSEQINELAKALAKAQGQITGAKKDTKNDFFKSSYADLASCWEACREPLSKNGLAVIQTTAPDDRGVIVITTLAHESGQWIRGELSMFPDKPGPQALGSCLTYARRYALAAMVGLAQVDDDAEGATERVTMSPQKRTKIISAMKKAVDSEDGPGLMQVVDELSTEEQLYIWNELRSDERAAIKKLLAEARAAAEQPDPNYMDPTPIQQTDKDARRAQVRGVK